MTKRKPQALRAVTYSRYSPDKRKKESIKDQERVNGRLIQREGFELVEKYADPDISGGTFERPEYQRMLAAAEQHQFDVVVAEDVMRLWREQAEQWRAIKRFMDLGIHIVTVSGVDSRQPNFELIIAMQGAAGEMARKEASYRTRRGLEGKARDQKPTGGRAFGYSARDKKRAIDLDQAKVVVRIYMLAAEGMSDQRIARLLNSEGVQPPGATWTRKDTGPNRKNTNKAWRPSTIRALLRNPIYKGQIVYNKTKWVRGNANSLIRKKVDNDPSEWIIYQEESLRIVPDELWDKVYAAATAPNPRRDAIRKGQVKSIKAKVHGTVQRLSGHGSKYWLGTLLVCAECGSNYIGDGARDYVCPAHTAGSCRNDLRFRRDDTHIATFDLLRRELLSDIAIERGRVMVVAMLEERAKHEDAATRAAADGAELRALDKELADLHKLNLRPAALAAAVEEIEKEKSALLAKANGKKGEVENRARKLLDKLPQIVQGYYAQIQNALKVLAQPDVVEIARNSTRRLLLDGRITLAPNAQRNGVSGPVNLKDLGMHLLELAGVRRALRGPDVSPVVAGA